MVARAASGRPAFSAERPRDVIGLVTGMAWPYYRRNLFPALALGAAVIPASAETRTGPLGAVFCEIIPSFCALIAGMLAQDKTAAAHLDDCAFLKAGVRIESEARFVAVRIYGDGTSVDGYTPNSNLCNAPSPERQKEF